MSNSAEHNSTVCRTPKHTRVQHLITADEASLSELEALLAVLPMCSTGRVFVEVPDDTYISTITAPARMTVTWLDRSRRSGAAGSGAACSPGAALVRAVRAWSDEMMCDEDDHTRVFLLGGFLGTADIVDHLTEARGVEPSGIHTPERFGLSTAF
ncbi:NADPH-dependent ferric siderophore reductase [Microbacterium halimionae]|uniref:NADPH-dependent ferric siderophore reductase n=1 Tax=Microbacterium halimionae TaxID=1526413 RepID=A0A7W3PM32_9MICO|nr:SIP domain-containing protein [Microbacterium halimionae]MBA8816582.1 NADPH-dependent ferric siderophore reductase [Microbacterium halimionae]NII95231.1 NADPH-dependent ferric siderophore reductase [Microbacterium halimionae]